MEYVSMGLMRSALRIADKIDDDLLAVAINAAEELVDQYCGRSFTQEAGTRYFTACDSDRVDVDDLVSITTLQTSASVEQVFDVTWATADYQTEPLNGRLSGIAWPVTRLRAIRTLVFPVTERASVKIEGIFGWPSVPAAVVDATLLQAGRLFKRFDSVLGFAGGPETGLIRVGRAIDGDVAQMLSSYRKGVEAAGGVA